MIKMIVAIISQIGQDNITFKGKGKIKVFMSHFENFSKPLNQFFFRNRFCNDELRTRYTQVKECSEANCANTRVS